MDVRFKYNEPAEAEKIYFEQIFAEKPGGGVLTSVGAYDVPPTTAVAELEGKLVPLTGYKLVAPVNTGDTTIKIAKGTPIAVGTVLGTGKKAVACTKVDKSNAEYDLVTVTLGVACEAGKVLYEAKAASADSAVPVLTPQYVTGNWAYANEGDQAVRLINGANLRKETANIASEVAALLPTINLV